MGTLYFIGILIFMFVGIPILLPWMVVKLTSRETGQDSVEPETPLVPPPSAITLERPPPRAVSNEEFLKNPFLPPSARVDDTVADGYNNSGGGSAIVPPRGVKGWSWGAFLFNWIWAVFNRTWIGLLCLVPYIGFLFCFYLGFKGRELAWRNKPWDSLEHFNRVQRRWSLAAVVVVGIAGIGIIAAITVSSYPLGAHRIP